MAQERGRRVSSGDVIAEIETDKATMEVEAVDEGVLGRIVVPEGAEGVAVNSIDRACCWSTARIHRRLAPLRPARWRTATVPRRPAVPAAAPVGDGTGVGGRRWTGRQTVARGPARRHGGGDAPRRDRVPHGRGGRGIPGRLQGEPGVAGGVRPATGDRYADHGARLRRSRRGRGMPGCGRSSSS